MSSCVMPAPLPVSSALPALRAHKRPRSTTEDAMSIERILKAHKRSPCDSPRATSTTCNDDTIAAETTPVTATAKESWPQIVTSDSVKYAIAFLRDSRHHALGLLTQNEWQRALSVLDKVERANDIICRQRRKVVLDHMNTSTYKHDENAMPARKVRFADEVEVAVAADVDRTPAKVPGFVREEILILRASRPIPRENYSELW